MRKDEGWLLAMDLSGAGLVVLEGPGGLWHRSWKGASGTALLFSAVREVLGEAGIGPGELNVLGVGRGPGSFTGVRTAVMGAKTLAEVLRIPLVAPNSLAVIAAGAASRGHVFVAVDARRKEVYHALFFLGGDDEEELPLLVSGPSVSPPEEAAQLVRSRMRDLEGDLVLAGSGIRAYGDMWPEGPVRWEADTPDPQALAGLCRELFRQGITEDHLSLRPLYLRQPNVGGKRGGGG